MAVTFDGPNLLIILEAGATQIDVEVDLYSAWKTWALASSENRKHPQAFRTVGGDELTPGVDAGAYFFLLNNLGWRIRPAEEDATILLTGNLAPEKSALPILVPTLGAYTVLVDGLQPITQNVDAILRQTQEATYQGAVHIDTVNGTAGTGTLVGTASEPALTLEDGLLIAAAINVRKIKFSGDIVLTQAMVSWVIEGISAFATIDVNGQDVSDSFILNCKIDGSFPVLTKGVRVEQGIISENGVANFLGIMNQVIIAGDVSLQQGNSTFTYCVSGVVGAATPVFDCQNIDVNLSVRNWTGGLEIINYSQAGSTSSFDVLSGNVILAATVSAGVIVVRGDTALENNSTGTAVIFDSTTPKLVWSEDLSAYVTNGIAGERLNTTSHIEKAIYIDTEAATNGDGTFNNPFNSLGDALTQAEAGRFRNLVVLADITIDRNLKNFVVRGIGSPVVDVAGNTVDKSEFIGVVLRGAMVGTIVAIECTLDNNLSGINGSILRSGINGDITVGGGKTLFTQCFSAIPGDSFPTVSYPTGSSGVVAFRWWSGGLAVNAMDNVADKLTVESTHGKVSLSPTCTKGTASIRGTCLFTDDSLGTTVDVSALINTSDVILMQDILQADEEYTSTTAVKKHKDTKAVLVSKNVAGGAIPSTITISE